MRNRGKKGIKMKYRMYEKKKENIDEEGNRGYSRGMKWRERRGEDI